MWASFNKFFIVVLLDEPQIKLVYKYNVALHLKSVVMPHYLAKFECSTLQLYSMLFNANVIQNRLFTVFVYYMLNSVLCIFIYNVTACVKIA